MLSKEHEARPHVIGYGCDSGHPPPATKNARGSSLRVARCFFLSSAAFAVVVSTAACSSEGSCADTATCPSDPDARVEADATEQDAALADVAEAGDAGDVSVNADGGDPSDRRDAVDALDRSEEGDRWTMGDTSKADLAAIDVAAIDVADGGVDGLPDAQPDAPACIVDAGRSPTDSPCMVTERYGMFVSPAGSDATGAGTRAAPFQTINRGLQAAKRETMRVFLCDNGSGFTDPVVIDATLDGIAVYGGFECTGWTLGAVNQRTHVHPPAGPALTVDGVTTGATFENLELRSADAATGASSIAVHIRSSLQVIFRNSRLVAGKGGAGQAGSNGVAGQDGQPTGPGQRGKPASCVPPIVSQAGGIAVAGACGSKGGNGGACDTASGSGPGESGTPLDGVDPPNRANGATNWIHNSNGGKGSDGVAGAAGLANAKAGTFFAAGYAPAPAGGDGTDGYVAQGGGGGSAGEADPSNLCIGASGGAGGMGGCGGMHGTGGGAGGASIALFSWISGITLDKCELVSADGGPGGNGGNGGLGGLGSQGAEGGAGSVYLDAGYYLVGAGSGGAGGNGGPGGGGAGGNGGPTYGIVYAGGRPSQVGGTTVLRGAGGAKGMGGINGPSNPPDGGAPDAATPDGAPAPDGGVVRASDGTVGDAAYELAIP